jgi:pyridoxal phosphate enzyme (YggS family)
MAAACSRCGRDPASVLLVAVTKYARLEWIRDIVALGVTELGENRPQQLAARACEISAPVNWHLIGPLQRNKVRSTLPIAALIHAADSLRVLEAIDRIAGEMALRPRVLIEVNLTGEEAKHGFEADDLVASWKRIAEFRQISIEGLMTMAAYTADPETARPVFARLRSLRDELQAQSPSDLAARLTQLSMGMTGDFEVAIEEGATIVRIGSALWQGLESSEPTA